MSFRPNPLACREPGILAVVRSHLTETEGEFVDDGIDEVDRVRLNVRTRVPPGSRLRPLRLRMRYTSESEMVMA